ncbi:MAG: LLM class F420-dependent oxidoreductase [Deltaproteobacteria bacterium]|jgi:probable F420-dependent oxidoreductase|nr:LLM class F420-dependent oxidoreductase [Deltaproteobacteria bacterium]
MKIGVVGINIGVSSGEEMIGFARLAEEIGLESVWTFEHVMVPVDYASTYPYTQDGKMAATPETNMIDPLISLSAVAAETRTLRLGTGINILPQTNPLSLAKQAASLDFISGGRFMLGVGIGWLAEEFKAMGVPFEKRGARHDDYIQALRKVWAGEVVEHQSEFVDWSGFKSYPLPVQRPLPLVIGGSKGRVFERVARYGEGWFSPTTSLEQILPLLDPLDAALAAQGRERSAVEITTMWVPPLEPVEQLPRYEEAGVQRVLVPMVLMGEQPQEGLKRFGDEVMAALASPS